MTCNVLMGTLNPTSLSHSAVTGTRNSSTYSNPVNSLLSQSAVENLPAFQDDRVSEQRYRPAGVAGQGSWGHHQHSTAPGQSYYHFYPGGPGSPMVSEVTAALYFLLHCALVKWKNGR